MTRLESATRRVTPPLANPAAARDDPYDHGSGGDAAADVPVADTGEGFLILDGKSSICLDDLFTALRKEPQ